MATLSVRTIAASCLGRQPPVSLKRDVFGVYGSNPQARSLRAQLDLAQTKPFIRVALVTVRPTGSTEGAYVNLQRDLDSANQVWQQECGVWIYCVDSIVAVTDAFGANGILDQNGCPLGIQDDPTAEEDALFRSRPRTRSRRRVLLHRGLEQSRPRWLCCLPRGSAGLLGHVRIEPVDVRARAHARDRVEPAPEPGS